MGQVRAGFSEVRAMHAEASRAGSREQYLIGRGLRSGGSTVRAPPIVTDP